MALSCSVVGITTERHLDTLDIVFHLATIGSAQADGPSHLAMVQKGYVVEDLGLRRECNHSQFVVFEAVVDPNQRSFPIEFARQGQRNTMLRQFSMSLAGSNSIRMYYCRYSNYVCQAA